MIDTRERILAAAADEVRESGVAGVRLKRIAEHAGVTTPLLYRYFADRRSLIIAGTAEWIRGLGQAQSLILHDTFDGASEIDAFVAAATSYERLQQSPTTEELRWGLAEGLALIARHPEDASEVLDMPANNTEIVLHSAQRSIGRRRLDEVSATALTRFLRSEWFGQLIVHLGGVDEHYEDERLLVVERMIRAVGGGRSVSHVDDLTPAGDSAPLDGIELDTEAPMRERITHMSIVELETVGPEDFKVKRIAEKVGVTSAHVYRYFESRQEMIAAATAARYDAQATALLEADVDADVDALTLFRRSAARSLREGSSGNRQIALLSVVAARRFTGVIATLRQSVLRSIDVWEKILGRLVVRGEIDCSVVSIPTAARMLHALSVGQTLFDGTDMLSVELDEWQSLYGLFVSDVLVP